MQPPCIFLYPSDKISLRTVPDTMQILPTAARHTAEECWHKKPTEVERSPGLVKHTEADPLDREGCSDLIRLGFEQKFSRDILMQTRGCLKDTTACRTGVFSLHLSCSVCPRLTGKDGELKERCVWGGPFRSFQLTEFKTSQSSHYGDYLLSRLEKVQINSKPDNITASCPLSPDIAPASLPRKSFQRWLQHSKSSRKTSISTTADTLDLVGSIPWLRWPYGVNSQKASRQVVHIQRCS